MTYSFPKCTPLVTRVDMGGNVALKGDNPKERTAAERVRWRQAETDLAAYGEAGRREYRNRLFLILRQHALYFLIMAGGWLMRVM